MSFDLQKVLDENLNLYEILQYDKDLPHQQLTALAIKKRYRSLALVYHPDKQPHNSESLHNFHLISLATHILTDNALREAYDRWFSQTRQKEGDYDKGRSDLITKLRKRESEGNQTSRTVQVADVAKIQEYGENLRKMKHFKIPYGDWKELKSSLNTNKKPSKTDRFYDSSTLRIELINEEPSMADRQTINVMLSKIFSIQELYDIYYSSRNDFNKDETIIVYAVFNSPQQAQQVFKRWTDNIQKVNWGPVCDITPRIPLQYYSGFVNETELDPSISKLIKNEAIIID